MVRRHFGSMQSIRRNETRQTNKRKSSMNRKEFLKNCACGLCTCAAVGLIAPESATAAASSSSTTITILPFLRSSKISGMELNI